MFLFWDWVWSSRLSLAYYPCCLRLSSCLEKWENYALFFLFFVFACTGTKIFIWTLHKAAAVRFVIQFSFQSSYLSRACSPDCTPFGMTIITTQTNWKWKFTKSLLICSFLFRFYVCFFLLLSTACLLDEIIWFYVCTVGKNINSE